MNNFHNNGLPHATENKILPDYHSHIDSSCVSWNKPVEESDDISAVLLHQIRNV